MALFRATFFFKDTLGTGWSETIYSTKSSLGLVRDAAVRLAADRIDCLGDTAALPFLRVSDDLVKRDSLVYKIVAGNQVGKQPGAEGAEYSSVCLLCRLQAGSLVRRSLYMRGIPDNIVVNSGQLNFSTGFAPAWTRWALHLAQDGWAIRTKDPTAPSFNIIGMVQVGADVTIDVGVNPGFSGGDPITISGVKGATQLNGSWSVFAPVLPTSFKIKCAFVLKPWLGGGTVVGKKFKLEPIDVVIPMRIGHRNAGGPFDRVRGRRKALSRI